MRTYKETLGIIKIATPFVSLPLTGPITTGANRAADDIARGLNMQGALRTAAQVPQQANSSFLSGIGNWIPLLFGMGGLGSLFSSNNTQTQTQPPPQKQVPAQVSPTTSTWDTVKNTAGDVIGGFKGQMNQINKENLDLDATQKLYRLNKQTSGNNMSKDIVNQRKQVYADQMNRLKTFRQTPWWKTIF